MAVFFGLFNASRSIPSLPRTERQPIEAGRIENYHEFILVLQTLRQTFDRLIQTAAELRTEGLIVWIYMRRGLLHAGSPRHNGPHSVLLCQPARFPKIDNLILFGYQKMQQPVIIRIAACHKFERLYQRSAISVRNRQQIVFDARAHILERVAKSHP